MANKNRDHKGELEGIRGELRSLQVVNLGGIDYAFLGSREEFIDFLKQSMLDKLVKLGDKWVYSRGDDNTLSKRMVSLGDGDDTGLDISIGFKTCEVFDRESIARAEKIVDDYEASKAREKLSGKKSNKKKGESVGDLPF